MNKATTYEITYSYKSAYGTTIIKKIKNLTIKKADEICKKIEKLENYKLIDISAEIDTDIE